MTEGHIITGRSRQNLIIAIVSLAVFMFSVDYSIVNITLPAIAKYFRVPIAHVSRIPLAYLLVMTSTVLLFGKLGDIKGFKKIFIGGLIIFVTGTFLFGFAGTFNILLLSRVYQCIGEAMFSPIAIAIAAVFLPSDVKGKALGFMATAQGAGFCLGPVIGGFINAHLGWHNIFFVNVPLGILMIIASLKIIPSRQPLIEDKRVDAIGAVWIFICLSTLVVALNSISGMGLKHPVILSCFAVSVIALVFFLVREYRTRNPILYLPLFLNLDFTCAVLSAFCVIFVYMGLIFLFPFYLNMVHGIDIARAGLILMVPALMVVIFAPIAGFLSDRFGSRMICAAGIAMTTVSFFMFSSLAPSTPVSRIVPSLALAGIAIGCFLPANNKLVMILAPADKQGMASAIYKILNSTGGVFGIAILPAIIMGKVTAAATRANIEMAVIRQHPDIMMIGFDAAFKFAMFICVAGLVFAILAKDKKA